MNLEANLYNLVAQGHTKEALQILAQMRDVHYLSPADANSPFVIAVERGYADLVRAFLAKGADPLALNAQGESMLVAAIVREERDNARISPEMYKTLRIVLDLAKTKGLLKPVFPINPAVAVAPRPDPVLLRFLLAYGADPDAGPNHSVSAVDEAFRQNNPELMKIIFQARPKAPGRNVDQMAYRAWVENKPQMLKMLEAAGGSHVRFIRTDPQPLWDALQPNHKIEELETLLKAGANPNGVKGADGNNFNAPVFRVLRDEARLRMLLKYGADPNTRQRPDGYTLLAMVLFSPTELYAGPGKTQHFPKLELTRLLLDSGVNPNGNHGMGSLGQYGALGLAPRDDRDVIALLVSRGATLAESEQSRKAREAARKMNMPPGSSGGTLVLAIGIERDDLALALLQRDRKIAPQDRLALPMAAKRGAHELVQALLAAGADPNATDEKGNTAMAYAMRRRDEPMQKMLAAAGASPTAAAANPELPFGSPFVKLAAKEIDEVAFFEPGRFGLGSLKEDLPFAFYGANPGQPEPVRCEHSATFGIIAFANDAATIQVGLCEQQAQRVRELAYGSPNALQALIAQLAQGGGVDSAKLAQMGWVYEKSAAPNGAEVHYFPMIWVGHGIGVIPTVVVIPRNGHPAIVVQADVTHLCGMQGMKTQTPLCSDTRKALTDIALRIEAQSAAVAGK
jgi:ankyrin repeat protein